MATFRLYPNGLTMGSGNPAPTGGIRGEVVGWSAGAVRRHKRWLYSIEAPSLSGSGHAITLTLSATPDTAQAWRDGLARLFRVLRDDPQVIRWHWVVEWQRRGTPHVHMAVYGDPRAFQRVIRAWLSIMEEWGPLPWGQLSTPITGAVGWLKYLSKHAARGVRHYQRQGKPDGWDKTGRLWGYGGDWPIVEPIQGALTGADRAQLRRWVRNYLLADARARGDWNGVRYLRRMLKESDPMLSRVRGISEFVPLPIALVMLDHLEGPG